MSSSPPPPPARGRAWLSSAAVAAVATLAYLATAARHVLGGDNGEFATLFAEGGVAHPSGYPVYTLYLRALSWLPGASPAHGAALATALLGGATVAALRAACVAWGAPPAAASFAAAVFACSPLAWRLFTQAEVFAANALLAALVVLLAAPRGPAAGARRAGLLGLVAGAGLGNHLSLVLLAPVGLYGVARGVRESARPARAAALCVAGLAPGLLSYGYLVAAARAPGGRWLWGDTGTLAGLARHVLRADYGTTQLSAGPGAPTPRAHLAALAAQVATDLLVAPALVGVVAALAAVALPRARGRDAAWHHGWPGRGAAGALLASLALAGPAFVARFNIPLVGLGPHVVERFYLLPEVLLTVFVALGAGWASARAALRPAVQALATAGVAAIGVALALPRVLAAHGPSLEDYLLDALHTAPRGAVLLGTGDHRTLGVPYVQRALGVRRDVLYIDPRLLYLGHYRRRVEAALGHALPAPRGTTVDTRAVAASVMSRGRAVYLTDVFSPAIPRSFATHPEGVLVRVLPPGERPPPPDAIEARTLALFGEYRWRLPDAPLAGWLALPVEDYRRPWLALAGVWAAQGEPARAAACRARADAIAAAGEGR